MHVYCYHSLMNTGNLKCPICKRFLPVDQDRDVVLQWQAKNYGRIFVPPEYQDYYVKVKCNDCGR